MREWLIKEEKKGKMIFINSDKDEFSLYLEKKLKDYEEFLDSELGKYLY